MNRIQFQDTHCFRGCLALFNFNPAANSATTSAVAEFSDGVVANAEVEWISKGEIFVRIESYSTGRGTRIEEKTWRLSYDHTEDFWKVTAKA